jgi:hypothetical protein
MLLVFLSLLLSATYAISVHCDAHDAQIYREQGDTFEHRFRPLGGLFVSRSEFVDGVRRVSGLSASCASCFGAQYICVWNNCKGACIMEGPSCDVCRQREGCTAELAQCTGGFGQPVLR